jgi:hypothetical protein
MVPEDPNGIIITIGECAADVTYNPVCYCPPKQWYFIVKYCPLLKRMQMTCTAWVQSLNTRDDSQEKTYRWCQQHEFLSLHYLLPAGRHWWDVSCITILNVKLLVTQKGSSAFPARNAQGQLQAPRSVSLLGWVDASRCWLFLSLPGTSYCIVKPYRAARVPVQHSLIHTHTHTHTHTKLVFRPFSSSLRPSKGQPDHPWFRRWVTGLSPRRLGFSPRSVNVEFVLNKVALGEVSLRVFRLSSGCIITSLLHTHIQFICHRCYTISETCSDTKQTLPLLLRDW